MIVFRAIPGLCHQAVNQSGTAPNPAHSGVSVRVPGLAVVVAAFGLR